MRDRLNQSSWWNRAPRNRTQTYYTRFLKGVTAPLGSRFTKSLDAFQRFGKDALTTRYSEYIGENDGRYDKVG